MQTEVQRKKGFGSLVIAVTALSLILVIALAACSSGDTSNAENGDDGTAAGSASTDNGQVISEGESLTIPISDIDEIAQFYPITVDGTRMEVVAVKASDGTIRTAFNTCQVCSGSPKAYFEQSVDTLQCQNCGNQFLMDRVEIEAGGCNPVPIFDKDKISTDESITISYDHLKANIDWFPSNWKT